MMEQRRRHSRAPITLTMIVVSLTVTQAAYAATDALGTAQLLKVTFGLLVVLMVMAALAFLLRRSQRLGLASGAGLQALGALTLGAHERVVLIRAGDKHLLVGVAPGQVQALCVLDEAPELRRGVAVNSSASGFARSLAAALSKVRAR